MNEQRSDDLRFCDFFIEYKLKVLSIDARVKFKDIAKYKWIGMAISIIAMIFGLVFIFIDSEYLGIFYVVSLTSLFVTFRLSERKKEQMYMLTNYYKPYSQRRLQAFGALLKEYGIHYKDTDKLKMLIEQAELARNKYSVVKGIKSPISATCTYIIIPILLAVVNRFVADLELEVLLVQTVYWGMIVVMLLAMWLAMGSLIKSMFAGDAGKYEDLKDDIQQIMLFGDKILDN